MMTTTRSRQPSNGTSSASSGNILRVSTCGTAAVLAGLSEDEDDDGDSLYPDDNDDDTYGSDKENSKANRYEQDRRLQYALFPLPPMSSPSPHHGTATGSGQITRASTPVSPAFSPHEPPRIPLPQLPDKPSPIILLPRSREGSGYFQLSHHSSIRERLHTWNDDMAGTEVRSAKSSSDTLSPILPYLRKHTHQPTESRSRTSTVRPFEEKLSLPPSPLHFHEFAYTTEGTTSTDTTNSVSLALEPPLPIQHRSSPSPSPSVLPEVPPKSPSVHSLQQFDEMLSIALEAMAETSSAGGRPSSSTGHAPSTVHSCDNPTTVSSAYHVDRISAEEDDGQDDVWDERRTWSRSSSEVSLPLQRNHSSRLQAKPSMARKQSKIIFDDISSSDEEAFDLSLDADTFRGRDQHAKRTQGNDQRHDDNNATLHSPEASSVSSSNWTSRRDSLATQTSQTSSSGGTSATSCAAIPSTVITDLGATLKQGLCIHQDDSNTSEDLLNEKELPDLVPSTPWASSLVRLPTRKSSMVGLSNSKEGTQQQYIRSCSLQPQSTSPPSKSSTPSPPHSHNLAQSQLSSLRSRLPKMGTIYARRPSDTPSHTSSSSNTTSSTSPSLPFSTRKSLSPPASSQMKTQNSLASFSINRLRSTKSTPLLRRKLSSQLPVISSSSQSQIIEAQDLTEAGGLSKGEGITENASLAPPPVIAGYRKGSLPEVPTRLEMGMRRRASFLPTSMRRG